MTRPRLSEEASVTVSYVKNMLGMNDNGELINNATAVNNNLHSWFCCLCMVLNCCSGYLNLTYGGLYYPSFTHRRSMYNHDEFTAPSKGSILKNLQFSRIDSKRIFHRLFGLNNAMKNMLLLENFLLLVMLAVEDAICLVWTPFRQMLFRFLNTCFGMQLLLAC